MPEGRPLALVTGGSGFLGRNLVPFLISQGFNIRALFRSEDAKQRILGALEVGHAQHLELVQGDLSDLPALAAAVEGPELVFHCAAKAALGGPYVEFERDNVQGTHHVLEAAQASSSVKRLVHVSTEAVCLRVSPWGGLLPLDGVGEKEPVSPPRWAPYSYTKALAEQAALAANSPQLETVVVRPHRIWGKGDTVILAALLGACRAGAMRWFTPASKTTTTHVLNACAALLLAARKGRPGQVYFVTDGQVLPDLRGFFTQYVQAVEPELPIPTSTLPFWLAWAAASLLETLQRVFPFLPPHPLLNRQALAVMGRTVVVRDDKIRQELGFENVVSIEQGMAAVREAAGGAGAAGPERE